MKKIILIGILQAIMLLTGVSLFGQTTKESRNPGNFSSIESNSSVDIVLKQGSNCSIVIEADNDIVSKVKTEVVGNKLTIGLERGTYRNIKVLRATITLPRLEELQIKGSGDVSSIGTIEAQGLKIGISGSGDVNLDLKSTNTTAEIRGSGDIVLEGLRGNLDISIAGSGDFDAKQVQLEKMIAKVLGSGDVTLTGTAQNLELEIMGSGDADLKELKAQTCNVSLRGSGEIDVYAANEIKAEAMGSGDLNIYGNPKMKKVTHRGSGELNYR